MPEPILTVSNLSVKLNERTILSDISFTAKKDETIAIIGPNGAGKTTLFRALMDMIPHKGKVTWLPKTKIGFVPQRLFIGPDYPLTTREFFDIKNSSIDEIDYVLNLVGFNSSNNKNKSERILQQKLATLSGGELQKVLIAWALIGHPDVLLFDEPTSGVDISSEETIYSLLHKLQEKEKITIILISHELEIVSRYADNVLCLNKNSVCYGPPRKALHHKVLHQLFGEDISFYHHH